MSKQLQAVIQEVKEGLKQASYSHRDATKILATLLNERGHVYEEFKMTQNGVEKTSVTPVENFRKFIEEVIQDAVGNKMDKADVHTFIEKYNFSARQTEALIEIMNEFLYQYLGTGRKYNLFDRADVSASIQLAPKEAGKKVVKSKDKSGKTTERELKYGAHKVIRQSSGCPEWLKNQK